MKMCCYNVCDLSFAFNSLFSFLFVIYSTLLVADSALSQSVLYPVKAAEVEDAILLGTELDHHAAHRKSIHKRDHAAASNPAWFGPRLGRKKRSAVSLDDEILDILDDRSRDDDTQQPSRGYPWALIVSDGKNAKALLVQFPESRQERLCWTEAYTKRQLMKPRLGRGGGGGGGDSSGGWQEDEEKMVKAPPYSPRLGRRSLIPLKPRLGRAGNNPETAVFKPRLGRDPGFNEFAAEYAAAGVDDKDH